MLDLTTRASWVASFIPLYFSRFLASDSVTDESSPGQANTISYARFFAATCTDWALLNGHFRVTTYSSTKRL